jgi:hypothetical protein
LRGREEGVKNDGIDTHINVQLRAIRNQDSTYICRFDVSACGRRSRSNNRDCSARLRGKWIVPLSSGEQTGQAKSSWEVAGNSIMDASFIVYVVFRCKHAAGA